MILYFGRATGQHHDARVCGPADGHGDAARRRALRRCRARWPARDSVLRECADAGGPRLKAGPRSGYPDFSSGYSSTMALFYCTRTREYSCGNVKSLLAHAKSFMPINDVHAGQKRQASRHGAAQDSAWCRERP